MPTGQQSVRNEPRRRMRIGHIVAGDMTLPKRWFDGAHHEWNAHALRPGRPSGLPNTRVIGIYYHSDSILPTGTCATEFYTTNYKYLSTAIIQINNHI